MENIEKINFLGIDHPALAARDVEQLSTWYCDFMGYERWFRQEDAGPPDRAATDFVWMLKAPDGSLLEVMPIDRTARPERTTWTPGWSHLALRVGDLDAAIAVLDKRGVEWASEKIPAIGGGWVRSARDGEGNMIQLLERKGL